MTLKRAALFDGNELSMARREGGSMCLDGLRALEMALFDQALSRPRRRRRRSMDGWRRVRCAGCDLALAGQG